MFSFTASVFVVALISMANGKRTEEDWSAAISKWMTDVTTGYNNQDLAIFRAIMVDDVKRFAPGRSLITGVNEIVYLREGVFKMELDNVRWTCGNEAVAEFKTSYKTNSVVTENGKGVAVFRDYNGTVKGISYIWNLNHDSL